MVILVGVLMIFAEEHKHGDYFFDLM